MRIAVLIAVIAAVVGCGASSAGTSASTDLRISFYPEGRAAGDRTQWTLRCEPVGGTLPRPGAACQKLDRMPSPFAPIRKGISCTEIYGGPGQALITGKHNGRKVWIVLALRNGCEIARAKRLNFLAPGMSASAGVP